MRQQLALAGGKPVRRTPFPPARTIGAAERAAVLEVLDSGVLSQFLGEWEEDFFGGPRVRTCEEAFARFTGARHAVAVNSATTALQVAYAAVGVGPGDEVIVTPFTMSATAATVVLQNAVPVFADIEPETFGLDPEAVAAAITPRTKAIGVTHLYGHPARMDGILEIAARHGLAVVEDAAQSLGVAWRGRVTGTLGDAGVLSLNYHKIIHSGEGGIVLTDDDEAAKIAQLARNHGEVVVQHVGLPSIANTIGSNYRMTEIEAALATAQLERVHGLLDRRMELAERLTRRLSELEGVIPPSVAAGCTHSYYLYAIRLELDRLEIDRATIAAALRAEGIPVSEGYVEPLYRQPLYRQRIGRGGLGCPWTCGHWHGEVSYDDGICPVTERLHDRELLLGDFCRAPFTEQDVDDVADAFEKVFCQLETLRAGARR